MRSVEKHFLSCFCVFIINLESNKWKRSFSEYSLANICLGNIRISQVACKISKSLAVSYRAGTFLPKPFFKNSLLVPVYIHLGPCKGIRIPESGFRNPANFCIWNPESWKFLLVESGIRDPGIRNTAVGIRNPTNNPNPESKFH